MRFYKLGVGISLLALSFIIAARFTFAQGQPNQTFDRIYLGTGEYDCKRDWDSIIRFDAATTEGGILQEDGLIPVKHITDADGNHLNFIHNMYVVEERDEMYISSLFTGIDYKAQSGYDCTAFSDFTALEAGSVGIIANVSTATGPQTLARHLYGDKTGLKQPHGIWIDESRDILYIANTYASNILVYENASQVDGNLAPDRVISSPALRYSTYIMVDEATDRLFATNFSAINQGRTPLPDDGSRASVLVFEQASTLDGVVTPSIRLIDDGVSPDRTGLTNGAIHITHNVWYDAPSNLAFVAHHTDEVLIYDLGSVAEQCDDPYHCELAPQALLQIGTGATLTAFPSVYSVVYDYALDRLYTTVGFTDFTGYLDLQTFEVAPGDYIMPGFPQNGIYVFDGVRDLEGSLAPEPIAIIGWQSAIDAHFDPAIGVEDRYFPPQPIWVSMGESNE